MPATRGQRWAAVGLGCLLSAGLSARADQHFEDGLRLFDSGEYAVAKQRFAESSDPRATTLEAVVDASMGQCQQALATLEAADTQDLTVAKLAGLALARCAIAEKRFDAALDALVSLPDKFSDDPDVLYETARLYLKGWNDAVRTCSHPPPHRSA